MASPKQTCHTNETSRLDLQHVPPEILNRPSVAAVTSIMKTTPAVIELGPYSPQALQTECGATEQDLVKCNLSHASVDRKVTEIL